MAQEARVVISDEASLFRTCLRQILEVPGHVIATVYGVHVLDGFQVVGEAGTGEELVQLARAVKPDLIILNPAMPRMSGLEVLREVQIAHHGARLILLAESFDRTQLLTGIQHGARGFLLKDSTTATLFEALACVMADQYWLDRKLMTHFLEWVYTITHDYEPKGQPELGLTQRQREVLLLVMAGLTNKDIARKFDVTEQTVKHHLTRIFERVGVSNRLELAILATRRGLDRTM